MNITCQQWKILVEISKSKIFSIRNQKLKIKQQAQCKTIKNYKKN